MLDWRDHRRDEYSHLDDGFPTLASTDKQVDRILDGAIQLMHRTEDLEAKYILA